MKVLRPGFDDPRQSAAMGGAVAPVIRRGMSLGYLWQGAGELLCTGDIGEWLTRNRNIEGYFLDIKFAHQG